MCKCINFRVLGQSLVLSVGGSSRTQETLSLFGPLCLRLPPPCCCVAASGGGLWVRGGRGAARTNGTASPIIRVYVLRVFWGDKEPPVAEDRFTWRAAQMNEQESK